MIPRCTSSSCPRDVHVFWNAGENKNDFLLPRLVLNVTDSLMAAHAGSHSIIAREGGHQQRIGCQRNKIIFKLFVLKEKSTGHGHISPAAIHLHPSGCCHATQLVTAWITLHEGLGQTITLEIQFCATSNVREDPSDAG